MEDRVLDSVAATQILRHRMTTWQRFVVILTVAHGVKLRELADAADLLNDLLGI